MATRRQSREWAIQLLFQFDRNPPENLDEALAAFWARQESSEKERVLAEELVRGALSSQADLDARLTKALEHWDIQRLGTIERSVLRLGVYEMLHREDIPPAVTINEAVDIAKYFGTSESGRFVNGVLDRIRKDVGGPRRRGKNDGTKPATAKAHTKRT